MTLQTAWGRIPTDVRLFLAFFALLVPARIAHTLQIRSMGVDGGYYLEVAKHVRDGEGLVTNLSLYHFGYETFPHPTTVYPLWPWLLGMSGRLVDLELVAHWLPLGLSFLAVGAAFGFGRQLWPEPIFPVHVPGFHAGHVFALGLAVQGDFVTFSSLPYTEPLAWSLLFLFLWRLVVRGSDLGLAWAVETGVWLGLLYLARFQLLVAPLAMAGSYAIRLLLGGERGRLLAHAATALGVVGLFVGSWFLHIRTFVLDAGLSSLLRFDQNRSNDLLHPIDVVIEDVSVWGLLLDRAHGFLLAWEPASTASYAGTFHTLHWALVAALPLLGAAGARVLRRDGLQGALDRLRQLDVHWFFLILFAVGSLLSVHLIHKHFGSEWYFNNRQGMIVLSAFLLPLGWLLRQVRPLPTVFGVVILSSTLVLGINEVWGNVSRLEKAPEDEEDAFPELIAWLGDHRDADGRLVVALDTQVQRIAWQTEGVGYHWIYSDTPYEDFLTLTDRLGVRYVILKRKALTRAWVFTADEDRLERDFVRVADEPASHVVFERRTTAVGASTGR